MQLTGQGVMGISIEIMGVFIMLIRKLQQQLVGLSAGLIISVEALVPEIY